MLFNSLGFYLFLIAVFSLWLLTSMRSRWIVLLGASYYLYITWTPWHALILMFCSTVTWWGAIRLSEIGTTGRRQAVLAAMVIVNLVPLFFFKYFNFFADSLGRIFSLSSSTYSVPHFELLLPVGISFYTFQAISYCADVYKGKIGPERHLGLFALYLAFFPKLISGPIERGANLLTQLRNPRPFDNRLFVAGMKLFFWGVFKKIVIADRIGMYVDMVFSHPQNYWGKTAILAAWLFTLQIYCDFSAYTDMAIGSGRFFGIELSQNFRFPYLARSVAEFWRRWHITLTSWFRDYVYIPLGGNKVNPTHWGANIMVVFLLSGLWHGAAWNFVWWGGLHGLFYLIGKNTETFRLRLREFFGIRGKAAAILQVLITFNLVSLAWVFFRASSIEDAFCLIRHMFINLSLPVQMLGLKFSTYLVCGFSVIFILVELLHYWDAEHDFRCLRAIPAYLKFFAYVGGFLIISLLGLSSKQFIYFHF
jgi:alginate O-acetyltransferase complex protein AlgI